MTRRLIQAWIALIVHLVAKVEVVGMEKIPRTGGCIVAANHLGRLDAFLVYAAISRDDVIMVPAEKYQKYAFFRWIARVLDAIWLDRYNADIGALRKVIKRIERGELMVIAPEGTRSPTEALLAGRPGAAYLASKTGVPVIPVAVTGTEDRIAKAQLSHLRRIDVSIRVGDPFFLPPLDTKNRTAHLQEHTDEIMCRIAALLPSKYRGVYANHPKLNALLS